MSRYATALIVFVIAVLCTVATATGRLAGLDHDVAAAAARTTDRAAAVGLSVAPIRGTLLAFGTALLVAGRGRRGLLAGAAGYTAVLAWSRVYLDEHWASDVLGGLLVGIAGVVCVAAITTSAEAARR